MREIFTANKHENKIHRAGENENEKAVDNLHIQPYTKSMKRFATAAFSFILCAATSHALTITDDPGGVIGARIVQVLDTISAGEVVKIDGYCASACTMFLANQNACATEKAILGFHAASGPDGTAHLWKFYPEKVRAYITAHGGLTKKPIIVSGKEVQKLIPAC